jgi:hypothetical protein
LYCLRTQRFYCWVNSQENWKQGSSTYLYASIHCIIFTIAKRWKQSECLLTDEFISNIYIYMHIYMTDKFIRNIYAYICAYRYVYIYVFTHTMEYYSTIRTIRIDEGPMHATTCEVKWGRLTLINIFWSHRCETSQIGRDRRDIRAYQGMRRRDDRKLLLPGHRGFCS